MSSLSIADLEIVESIIRACQTRGAFRAEELLAVGTVYSKVLQILNEEKAKKLRLPSIPEAPTEEKM